MKNIFKWFTLPDASERVAWFTNIFEHSEFEGIDKVLVLFLAYCAELGIPACRNYLESFLLTELKKLVRKYNIKLPSMDNFDYREPTALEEAVHVITDSILTAYDAYCAEDLTDRSFKVDMKTFIEQQKTARVLAVMSKAFPSLSTGSSADEVIDSMQYEMDRISSIYNTEHLKKLDFFRQVKEDDSDEDERIGKEFLFKTNIPCVDGDKGGFFSKEVWSLTGQPGSGKTRLAAIHFAYQAAVVYKLDVLFDELELEDIEVKNMMIAHHIVNLYNGKIKIPDSLMNENRLTAEQMKYYEAAKIDLFESGKYGNIFIRTENLIVERMDKDTLSVLKRNKNMRLWVIDYAGIAKSKPTEQYAHHKDGYEIIQDLYKNAKEIAKTANIGVLILNQFNKEGVAASLSGKRIMAGHVEGGQIIERHADYDIAMCFTEEQEQANIRTLSTVKKRSSKGFWFVPFIVDLSVSNFRQQKIENVI